MKIIMAVEFKYFVHQTDDTPGKEEDDDDESSKAKPKEQIVGEQNDKKIGSSFLSQQEPMDTNNTALSSSPSSSSSSFLPNPKEVMTALIMGGDGGDIDSIPTNSQPANYRATTTATATTSVVVLDQTKDDESCQQEIHFL
jgi:hypothetical protein